MNAREWKPGDVAMIGAARAIVVTHMDLSCHATHPRELHWHRDDGDWNVLLGSRAPGDVRPLVVIDPEDRAQVKALCWARWTSHDPYDVDKMQAALRSLITPPKPEEPLGLGAVVEDAEGRKYIRTADTDCAKPWSYANNYSDHSWADVAAVKVLSEGVTA